MDLFERVSEDIKNAMKAKDKVALETLRNVKKFFLEAKTAPGANDTLTDADALKIMQKLVKQGKDSAAIYVQQIRRKGEEPVRTQGMPFTSPAANQNKKPKSGGTVISFR